MSKLCKLMVFVAVFGLSFVSNAFADEPVVDTQPVAQATDVVKDIKADENKVVKVEKKVEKKKHHKKVAKKHDKKAEQEKDMHEQDMHEQDKQ